MTTVEASPPSGSHDGSRDPQRDADAVVAASGPDRSSWRTLALFGLGAVALVLVPLVASRLVDPPAGTVHRFEIPAGTADAIARGADVQIIPADLDLRLADRLVVVNRDDVTHQIGPFRIAPGETFDRGFDSAVSLSGFCSLHPSSGIEISVEPAP